MINKLVLILSFAAVSLFCYSQSGSPVDPFSLESRDKLNNFIQEWWKVSYKWGGDSKNGIDCSAFTRRLFHEVYHVSLPRTSREQYRTGKTIKKSELQAGDLLFFKNKRGVWHVGMYIIDGFFVHATSRVGVTISHLEKDGYEKRMFSQKRVI